MGRMKYAGIDYGRSPFQPVRTCFGPRIGFAFDVSDNGRTVVRGGYGIFYPTTFYRDFFGSTAGFAGTTTTYDPPGGNVNFPAFLFKDGFPYPPIPPLGARLGPSAFLGSGVSWDQPREKVPMSQQWSLSLQRQLPGYWVIEATYSANRLIHLVSGSYDYNQLDPQHLALGLALQDQVRNPYAGQVPGALRGSTISRSQSLRPYPYYTGVAVRLPRLGSPIYHALLLSVEKRLSKGVAVLASYTNAKLISDSAVTPINFGPVEQVGVVGYQNGKFNRRAERSVDPTDVSQRMVVSGIFELPFGRGRHWTWENTALNRLLDGELRLRRIHDPETHDWMLKNFSPPTGFLYVDAASVVYLDEQDRRWRLPRGDVRLEEAGPLGPGRIAREVSTERDLFNAGGTFYELPANSSGGIAKVRPVATHNRRIQDFCSFRGLLVLSGVSAAAQASSHVVRSSEGSAALGLGVSDDLWKLGKPRGEGGPWKDTSVKANVPSDPYLLTGYDHKRLQLRQVGAPSVRIRVEIDITGNGLWREYQTFVVPANKLVVHEFPEGFEAYWIRTVSDKDCTATAWLRYE
jgi:hypothetical protein